MTARAVLFAHLIALGCVSGAPVAAQSSDTEQVAAVVVSPERVAFLAGQDLPEGTWLLLTPLAFGGHGDASGPDFRVIRDTAALRAAAPRVWVENDDAAKLRLLLLATVFLSPPANGFDDEFARLVFPDGRTQSVTAFHPAMQDGMTAPPHDLAGLLQIAEPVFARLVPVYRTTDYADLVARIGADPDMFTLQPLPPVDLSLAFPVESELLFPSLLMRDTDVTDARTEQETARTQARFADMFGPPGRDYLPFVPVASVCGPPAVMDAASDMPVLVDGEPLVVPGFSAMSFAATLYSGALLPDRIDAAAPGFLLGEQGSAAFDAAFAALLQQKLGATDTDDYFVNLDCWAGALQAFWPRENVGYVSYYRVGQGERQ